MKTLLIGLAVSIAVVSCDQTTHGKPRAYSIPNNAMNKNVLVLHNAAIINGPAVGFAGTRTKEYESYEWLLNSGSDSLLNELVNYSNPYTRTYAFIAMCRKKHPAVKQVFEKHKNDTTTISAMEACEFQRVPLNQFWQEVLSGLRN